MSVSEISFTEQYLPILYEVHCFLIHFILPFPVPYFKKLISWNIDRSADKGVGVVCSDWEEYLITDIVENCWHITDGKTSVCASV